VTYLWTCLDCGAITEVRCLMAEMEIGPDQPCKCKGRNWKRGLHPVPHIGPKHKGGDHGAKLGSKG
jgi:hypothetical protein